MLKDLPEEQRFEQLHAESKHFVADHGAPSGIAGKAST
jgi:hypothetical protein